ncbi:hypothetical protein E3N88_07232 [Mikania micrantha]|uniref:Uncharacterized protein n=1 Tax=Mikania micrantha TaxID=192012 RepID=A0A5N6PSC6_9ASTR|nr:hypothetical protein E3N88_07232 [Mikania micrantha]
MYPDHAYKLDKALYGLPQAPRAWDQKGVQGVGQRASQRAKVGQQARKGRGSWVTRPGGTRICLCGEMGWSTGQGRVPVDSRGSSSCSRADVASYGAATCPSRI